MVDPGASGAMVMGVPPINLGQSWVDWSRGSIRWGSRDEVRSPRVWGEKKAWKLMNFKEP